MKKTVLAMILIGIGMAGCSAVPVTAGATQNGPVNPANSVPPGTIWTAAPGNSNAGATPVATNPGSMPLAVTVRPPAILIGPGTGTLPASIQTPTPFSISGWSTFTSLALGVAVNYPPDWSVTVQPAGASFLSPQGAQVLLAEKPGGENNSTAQGCNSLANAYGLTALICSDASTGLYSASFTIQRGDGTAQQVILSTTDRAALDTYKGMLSSLHAAK